jgi:hypothetical protein
MTSEPHRRYLPAIKSLSRRPAANVIPLPSPPPSLDHRVGLVCRTAYASRRKALAWQRVWPMPAKASSGSGSRIRRTPI